MYRHRALPETGLATEGQVGQGRKLREKVLAVPVEMRFSEIWSVLEEAGWTLDRTVGSHHQFTKPGRRTLVVPAHGGKVR